MPLVTHMRQPFESRTGTPIESLFGVDSIDSAPAQESMPPPTQLLRAGTQVIASAGLCVHTYMLACTCYAPHHLSHCWCRMLYYMHRPRWYRMRRIRCSSRQRMHHRPVETARLTYGRCASRAVHSTASRRGAECSRPSHSAKWLCSRGASHSCDDQRRACRVSRDYCTSHQVFGRLQSVEADEVQPVAARTT